MPTLPQIKEVKLPTLTFPTDWQAVIFRNYGYVSCESIARVLACDSDTVRTEAARLGLANVTMHEDFYKRGYITIIRSNWYLLPYSQICDLIDVSEERLAYILKNEDFLDVKLGGFKPLCKDIVYTPLTSEEIITTEKISKVVKKYASVKAVAPFDFFSESNFTYRPIKKTGKKRIVHGYLSPCLDAFDTDGADTLPDALLEEYKRTGIDGVWIHALLSSLSPYPFSPELSAGYEKRRENLNKLIKRCAKYGISVYLYFNEPRALPEGSLTKYDHLIGRPTRRTLCLEKKEAREYLYDAVKGLCESAKGLGGIFTITMSENPTHCNYARRTDCPVCKDISPEVSAAKVNNIIYNAIKDSGSKAELVANLWGWSPFLGWSDEQIENGISLLDKNISVMCVSEYDLEIEKGGISSRVIDYSISNPGPSEITKKIIDIAKASGLRVYAKIQASNSWECSAVPYVPVFDLVYEHLESLKACEVEDYFLSWTLGGYPSPSINLAARFSEGISLDDWYKDTFGALADEIHNAVRVLCDGFRNFPFSITVLYMSPKNLASANLWDIEPEEKTSTMVCYSFDDIDHYTSPYPPDVYISLMKKLISGFERGVSLLADIKGSPAACEMRLYAEVGLCHYKADLLQTEFALAKKAGDKTEMARCITEEKQNAERLLSLMRLDAKIGFETSNHYFYTERSLIEKIVRMENFSKKI